LDGVSCIGRVPDFRASGACLNCYTLIGFNFVGDEIASAADVLLLLPANRLYICAEGGDPEP